MIIFYVTDGPTVVDINILFRSFPSISDSRMEYSTIITFREEWRDERLIYDDFEGKLKYLTLVDTQKVWMPDLFFNNEREGHIHTLITPNMYIRIFPNGQVLYSSRLSLTLSCPMDLRMFPMDKQTCSLGMVSYGYQKDDIILRWKDEKEVQVKSDMKLPKFFLQGFETGTCDSITNTGEYSCLKVNLFFKRDFSFYLIQIYIPCCMLIIVSWVSFWLDPGAAPARVSLGITTLLTMATQTNSVNNSLPPVSYTKAIDVWQGACMCFVFSALLEYALVNTLARSDKKRAERRSREEQSEEHSTKRPPINRSKRIDVVSRVLFPVLFLLFNVVYWVLFLPR